MPGRELGGEERLASPAASLRWTLGGWECAWSQAASMSS